jgi:hypothetical protein
MNASITFGLFNLQLVLLQQPFQKRSLKAMLGVKATVTSAFSEVTADNLCLELQDFLAFRKRLHKFIQGKDSSVGWHTLMPMFDLSLTSPYEDYVHAEVRISPNIRGERHFYDFDTTIPDVREFSRCIDVALLDITLKDIQV